MGLMREARRAGIYPARHATAHNRAAMPTNVTGSVAEVPKSRDAMRRAATRDATVPKEMPVSASSSVLEITSRSTRP